MASPLMDLPRELRDRILSYVLCSQGSPQLIQYIMRQQKLGAEGGVRFPEKVEPAYPPRDAEGESLGNVKRTANHSKNTPPCLSVSPEDEKVLSGLREIIGPQLARHGLTFTDGDVEVGLDSDEEDEEDEGTDSEDGTAWGKGENDSDDDEPEDFVSKPRHRNCRYKLETLHPLNLALLRVSRQLHGESLPIFYGGVTFILDCESLIAIHFFKTLPERAFKSITSIAFTGEALMEDDCYVREGWSEELGPFYVGPPTMSTPTGAFLAANMPKLAEVYLYVPYGGDQHWYANKAPIEMQMLLAYGRIERLYFVFFGRNTAGILESGRVSKECYSNLMGLLDKTEHARRQYKLFDPFGQYAYDEDGTARWGKEHDRYVAEHENDFEWRWGDRDIDMGSDGNVQAVIELSRRRK
ncbi:hypothetical protein LTR37_001752 [Vermiconidia calcicola]|uniref:Uncharacterized protein n=1 Tax=Vermiconidia calcicola TaxID=1690605 RepID=A0ACC3NV51_9PEZI|nr:hypothetical protein LTR37_001752 [Vermiconidia calcicola]